MGKAFITGRGLITPLGNGKAANVAALRAGTSGIVEIPEFVEHKLPSTVGGMVKELPALDWLDRKQARFCPRNALMSVAAVAEALEEAKISKEEIPGLRIAVIGGTASSYISECADVSMRYLNADCRLREVSPLIVPRVMPSSAVANLSLVFGFTGESYDVSAACSTGAISVMVGARLIEAGLYDIVVAGGAEQLDWVQCLGFCAARALSCGSNADPAKSSRPFDLGRDGFVLAEGAGYVVLESEASLKRRGVRAITEITGVASNSNAKDMVVPIAEASEAVMREAVANAGLKPEDIGYVNTHGTSTKVGDPVETAAIKNVFGMGAAVNSTKSQTGHMVGATGSVELIFTSLMLEHKFISPSINLDNVDPACEGVDLVRELREVPNLKHALSNSFAFGGSNISVVLSDCAK